LIKKAFGNTQDCLGVCLVKNVPGFVEKRAKLLKLASVFAQGDPKMIEKCIHEPSSYLFGWSHGKEIMNGKLDTSKGSYYNNPLLEDPQQSEEYVCQYPEYGFPNVWPEEMPELKEAFKDVF
jgi:hypothetical protein